MTFARLLLFTDRRICSHSWLYMASSLLVHWHPTPETPAPAELYPQPHILPAGLTRSNCCSLADTTALTLFNRNFCRARPINIFQHFDVCPASASATTRTVTEAFIRRFRGNRNCLASRIQPYMITDSHTSESLTANAFALLHACLVSPAYSISLALTYSPGPSC